MTRPEFITLAGKSWKRVPQALLEPDTLQALVAEGMSVIRKDLIQARFLAKTAISGARRLSSPHDLGGALRLAGHVELLGGKAKKAVQLYREARDAFTDEPIERSATAVAMLQALAYIGDYQEAFGIAEEALATFAAEGDDYRAARVKANLANALHRLDRLTEAKSCYEEAMPVLISFGAIADLAIVARNYGVCLMGLSEYRQADEMYSEARKVFAEADETSLLLEIDLNRAYLLGRNGLIREAILSYRRLRENLPSELGFEIGHSFLDQADFMLEVGLWTDAEDAAQRACSIFERLGVSFELGKSKLFEGMAQLKRGRFNEASLHLKEAKRRLTKEPNSRWHAMVHLASAEQKAAQGRTKAAYRDLVRANSAGTRTESSRRAKDLQLSLAIDLGYLEEANRLREEAAPAYRAKLALKLGKKEGAEALALEALAAYDSDRALLGPSLLRQATASARQRELRECFRALTHPRDRLEAAARLKNQSLAEITSSPESAPASDELRAKRSLLFRDRVGEDKDVELALAARWRESRLEAESTFAVKVSPPEFSPGSAFAEVFHDQEKVFVFLCTGDKVEEHLLGSREEIQRQARLLRLHLARRDSSPDGVRPILAWLGSRLEPILPPDLHTLYVGRDFPLANTPLHAALVRGEPLLRLLNVVYAPSAASWQAVHQRPAPRGNHSLVIGAPDAYAPQIAREALAVSQQLRTSARSSSDLETLMPSAGIVHLAAHGLIREDRPLFSSLLLGERNLSVFDIMQMSLSAELVTLSGCATGVAVPGETNDSEGFIEALLAAGARSVLASLWEVYDEAAALWMESFYSFRSELGSLTAYRKATEEVMRVHPHPADWAPFALFGDPQ